MDKTNIKHSKKRNTALLYEFFVRHISKCFLESKKDEARQTLSVMKKYFHKNSLLNEELSLFQYITDAQGKFDTKNGIEKVIGEVLSMSKQINDKKLDAVKSQLIKEVNDTFKAEQFYSYRIPNYTVLASIQTLLNESRLPKNSISPVQKVALQESISSYLFDTKKKNIELNDFATEHSSIIYKVVTKKFNEKYSSLLTESQKNLLTKYAVYLSSNDKQGMKKFLSEQVGSIDKSLSKIQDKQLLQDKDLMGKIGECKKKLLEVKDSEVSDDSISQLLKYMELVEELNK